MKKRYVLTLLLIGTLAFGSHKFATASNPPEATSSVTAWEEGDFNFNSSTGTITGFTESGKQKISQGGGVKHTCYHW